jgi:uncharacterized membrane protein YeiH
MPVWLEQFAVAVCAISGALAAAGRRLDLFGVIVLAIVTAVGGGTIRDLCLGARPVFWVENPTYILTATAAALGTFVVARFWVLPQRVLLIADAVGLALFTIAGTEKALIFQSPAVIAVLFGIVTGVAGGCLRDVLRREIPLVFQPDIYLYATASFCGAVVFVALNHFQPGAETNRFIAMAVILVLRLLAMWWKLKLPVFHSRDSDSANPH